LEQKERKDFLGVRIATDFKPPWIKSGVAFTGTITKEEKRKCWEGGIKRFLGRGPLREWEISERAFDR